MTPTHVTQSGILDLIFDSGIMAKFVLLLLLGASMMCWAVIFTKWRTFRAVHSQNRNFVDLFWSGKSVDEILSKTEKFPESSVASLFKYGIKELKRLSGGDGPATTTHEKLDQLFRALNRASVDELAALEKHLGWLASTASAAPFVGLFGTVWGIMNSFQNIGATGNANLAVVAPGISEALITTAAGIAAAVPAVIAYNYFAGQLKKTATDMETFAHDFIAIVQRGKNRSG